MINEYIKNDSFKILHVINDSAVMYKGIIPDNCWHEPYMSKQELDEEFTICHIFFVYYFNLTNLSFFHMPDSTFPLACVKIPFP